MVSSKARFAMRALLELSRHYENGNPLRIEDIAARQNIPFKFLQQILRELKDDGILLSRKGPGGGYTLASSPADISLASLLRAIDGPIAPISCASVYFFKECGCPEPDTCAIRAAFAEVRDSMVEVLEKRTFADLLSRSITLSGISEDLGTT